MLILLYVSNYNSYKTWDWLLNLVERDGWKHWGSYIVYEYTNWFVIKEKCWWKAVNEISNNL